MTAKLWAGLDVGLETTSICTIDDSGAILQQVTCPSGLASVHHEIRWLRRRRHAKIGLEAGGLTLARGLRSLGYSVDMYETRQLSKFLRARRNKTDADDAIGIAEAGRIGASLISKVYLKSFECQSLQSRLSIRRFLIRERVAAMNMLFRQVEQYGGRISRVRRAGKLREPVEAEIRKVFGRQSNQLTVDLRSLLDHCEHLLAYQEQLDWELKCLAIENDVCRRFMEIPGIGPICALSFYAIVGDPHRFSRSTDIGSYFGLAPRIHASGLSLHRSRISRMGNSAMRSLLVQAAVAFMRSKGADPGLRSWTSNIEQRSGTGQSRIALARKLAVIMVAMWKRNEPFKPASLEPAA